MQAVSTAAKVAITNVTAALLLKLASSSLRVESGPCHTPIVVVASSAVDVFRNSLSGLPSVVANMMHFFFLIDDIRDRAPRSPDEQFTKVVLDSAGSASMGSSSVTR